MMVPSISAHSKSSSPLAALKIFLNTLALAIGETAGTGYTSGQSRAADRTKATQLAPTGKLLPDKDDCPLP